MYRSSRVAPRASARSRALALALLLPALVALLTPTPVAAAVDHVTTCSGDPATMGSLLNVLGNASAGDTIVFDLDCPPATPITPTFPIFINENLTIDGTGHNVAVDGGGTRRVFEVDSGTVTLNGLTIQHGLAQNGGGIFNNGGTLTVTNSTLASNTVNNGDGGGISNTSTLIVINSTFIGNTTPSTGGGGGIGNSGGTAIVTNSTFSNNSGGRGGGIGVSIGSVTVTNSTIVGNSSPFGGGIRAVFVITEPSLFLAVTG